MAILTPMTLSASNYDEGIQKRINLKNEPYLVINIILAGIIFMIFAYSLIYSPEKNNYPVVCIHEKLTGQPCVSCGLSHSFSLILRGNIDEAYQWNIFGMRIFIFFVVQFMLRIFLSLFFMNLPGSGKMLIKCDIAGSSIIFIVAFWPFIVFIFSRLL